MYVGYDSEFEQEVVETYIDGYSKKEIANFANCTESKVRLILNKYGIYSYMRKEDQAKIWELHEQGLYDREIAEIMHCTRENITHFLNKRGVSGRKEKINDIELRNRISNSLINRYNYTNNPNFENKSSLYDTARGLFKTIKNRILRNNPNVCAICGSTERIETHHLKSFNGIFNEFMQIYSGNRATFEDEILNFPDFMDENNILMVCHSCHKKIHSKGYPELNKYILD